ncbi:MAG: Lrp/AsnC family transcriptional regulator [Candidatus Thorarchaeota archaeon]
MDNVDKQLVSLLQKDGRTSLSEIGKELKMSHVAVSKRLDKLVKKDLVHIGAGVNSEDLDIKLLFIALEVESLDVAERIYKKFGKCPRLLMLAPVSGSYNMIAVLAAEDAWTLQSITGTCSVRTEPGVRRSESWFGNSPVVPKYLPINLAPHRASGTKAPCRQDCAACKRYQEDKCVGCPTTIAYRGRLWSSPLTKRKRRGKGKS